MTGRGDDGAGRPGAIGLRSGPPTVQEDGNR